MTISSDAEHLKNRLKRGIFDEDLRERAQALWEKLQHTQQEDERYFKAKAMVSEISYYYNEVALARESVAEFENFAVHTQNTDNPTLALERIRCYLAHIQATLYYENEHAKAKKQIETCIDFIEGKLRRRNFRCDGTLAWAYYQVGCCARQLHRLEEAEEKFIRSATHQGNRARNKQALLPEYDAPKRLRLALDELLFCNRRLAIVLGLGIGFCEYTRGRLSAAHEKLTVARTLLTYCEDPLNEAYLNLLFGSVMRCQSGSDSRQLLKARRLVTKAHKGFKHLGHNRYALRANYELALIYLALADRDSCSDSSFNQYLEEARDEAKTVFSVSEGFKDGRWISHALVIESRIERKLGNFPEAIDLATKARGFAGKQTVCEIDARIARAESNISWVRSEIEADPLNHISEEQGFKLRAGRTDLEEALRLNKPSTRARSPESHNEKIESVCRLLLARICVVEKNQVEAKAFFQQWKELRGVEHQNIKDLARRVKVEIDGLSKIFQIDPESDDLSYEAQDWRVREFLIGIAESKFPRSQPKQAEFLRIARETLARWKAELAKRNALPIANPQTSC
jgi:hypothetical protein